MNLSQLRRLHELALTYLEMIQAAQDRLEIMNMNNDTFAIGFHESEIETAKNEINRFRIQYLKTVYELQTFEYGQDAI
jgi:hypothetical protein